MKVSVRTCPICEATECEVLCKQTFVLLEGHPLSDGYDVVCCDRCRFVYADTTISQSDCDLFYARFSKYEDNKTATGGGESSWDAERLQKTAASIVAKLPNKSVRILDIGCANGGLLKALKDLGYSRLCGLDPSPVCVENTQRFGIEAYPGSLLSIADRLGQFDCVILSHVLEHVQSVKSAVYGVAKLTRPGGMVYVEVPDASRYADFVTAPFQDFNTEHINHFSLQCLANLAQSCGWTVLSQGQKIIYSAINMPYPAIYSFWAHNPSSASDLQFVKDEELCGRIKMYIAQSQIEMEAIEIRLVHALQRTPEVIVWGTGQLAMKLLAETSLRLAKIVAFVDGNPINQGKRLQGIPILAPAQAKGMQFPIVVTSILHQDAIVDVIRNQLDLPNDMILLR